jgi:hypothetical protein
MVDIFKLAQWLGALSVIGGVALGIVKFFKKLSRMDEKLDTIMAEQRHIAKGTIAALKGLKEQGCNGPVSEALEELEQHIFEQAHK